MHHILVALLLCLPAFAFNKEEIFVVEARVVRPVPKFEVVRRYVGTIAPEKFSLLSPKGSGTVARIHVQAGQRVKKDEILISLKSDIEKRSLNLALDNLTLVTKALMRNRPLFEAGDITETDFEKMQKELTQAGSLLEQQRRQVESVEIRSPITGVAGVPRVKVGETIGPGTTAISVTDGPFSLVINIPGSQLAEVNVGQTVRVKSLTATISAVERTIDPVTRSGFAKAILLSCDGCIVNDSVYAHLTVHEKPNAILIDRNAVFYRNAKPHVVAVVSAPDGSKSADIREVVVGREQEGQVEVITGVNDGDEIVIA